MKELQLEDIVKSIQKNKRRDQIENDLRELGRFIENGVADYSELQDYRRKMREYIELGGNRRDIEKIHRWC